jgi:hypothetical protein
MERLDLTEASSCELEAWCPRTMAAPFCSQLEFRPVPYGSRFAEDQGRAYVKAVLPLSNSDR